MRSQETQTLDLPRQSADGILQKERGNSLNTALLERPPGWKYLYANEGLNVNFFLLQLGGSWETILQLQGSLQASGHGRLWSCTIGQTRGSRVWGWRTTGEPQECRFQGSSQGLWFQRSRWVAQTPGHEQLRPTLWKPLCPPTPIYWPCPGETPDFPGSLSLVFPFQIGFPFPAPLRRLLFQCLDSPHGLPGLLCVKMSCQQWLHPQLAAWGPSGYWLHALALRLLPVSWVLVQSLTRSLRDD